MSAWKMGFGFFMIVIGTLTVEPAYSADEETDTSIVLDDSGIDTADSGVSNDTVDTSESSVNDSAEEEETVSAADISGETGGWRCNSAGTLAGLLPLLLVAHLTRRRWKHRS